MLEGLPERALDVHEIDALTASDVLRLAVPATPESLREDEGRTRVYDLLLFLDGSVAAIAYDEGDGGWTAVTNESGEDPLGSAIDALLEHRGYDLDREEDVREFVRGLHDVAEEALDEGHVGTDADDASTR